MSVKLTISLLCPGRTEDVFKTLDSIKPILSKVSSELIIVDTGCPDEFRKRLENYTKQIIPFKWTGDFAEARNVGLDAAKGEWFMFIDDDEWFEDPTPVISFFNSSNANLYDYATYYKRNYWDFEMSGYEDVVSYRMFRLQKGYRFVSKIHEYYNAPCNNIALLDCFVHHFGYVYKSEEDKMAHSMRNLVPLKEMIEENPKDMHSRYQLVQEYFTLCDWKALEEECSNCIEIIENGISFPKAYTCTFYIGKVLSAINTKQNEKAYEEFKKALSYSDITKVSKARLYVIILPVLLSLNKYEEIEEAVKEYTKIYGLYAGNKSKIAAEENLFASNPFDENSTTYITNTALMAYVKEHTNKNSDILNSISEISEETSYFKYAKGICALDNENFDKAQQYFEEALSEGENIYTFDDEIFNAASEEKLSLKQMLDAMDTRDFLEKTDDYISKKSENAVDILNTILDNLDESDIRYERCIKALVEYQLIFTPAEEFAGFEDMKEVFKYWSDLTLQYYSRFIKLETFSENTALLPRDAEAAIKINGFAQTADRDVKIALGFLKQAAEVYAPVKKAVQNITKLYVNK